MDKVWWRIHEEKPDVLEVHSPYLGALGALVARQEDFKIRTFHWHADFIDTYLVPPLKKRSAAAAGVVAEGLWGWVRRIGRGSNATIVASRTQARKLHDHGVPRVECIPFGVDRDIFSPSRRNEGSRAKLIGGVPKGPIVVALGRFSSEKEWGVLLDSFFRYRERHAAHLVCYGDGPERERMAERIRGRDDVRLMGFEKDREALAIHLASADVFLHACRYETFGLSVAEAQASGLPVVVPSEGGAFEQLDARSGESFSPGESEAAASALERLLSRDPLELRAAAIDGSKRVRSVEEHFDDLFALYERLLSERARA